MSKKRTIVVVTGTRAEFGLLTPVMRAIAAHRALSLRVVVTGVHLTTDTWRDIRSAGFTIDHRAAMQRRGEAGRAADVAALGRGVAAMGRAFEKLRPDVVLVLGDRIEVMAAALAASVGGYRLAHIHGGDRAQGVADEAMRHAVSKLAHLHFPATALSRKRLVRMGEDKACIFQSGSPAVEGLADVEPATDAPDIIVMQHPIGARDAIEARWMRGTLKGSRLPGCKRLVMAPNGDPGCGGVRAALRGVDVVEHLPRTRFLRLLKGARAIVGNSSAGLIEAAVMRVPCVNVGPRQDGREKPANVIECDYGETHVRVALEEALALDLRGMKHPYGNGHAGAFIAHKLATVDLDTIPLHKRNAY